MLFFMYNTDVIYYSDKIKLLIINHFIQCEADFTILKYLLRQRIKI